MASQNQWVYDLENLTYAIVKTRCEKKLKTKYPKLKFTQEEQSDSAAASFPTVLADIEKTKEIFCQVPEVYEVLLNPVITAKNKYSVIYGTSNCYNE